MAYTNYTRRQEGEMLVEYRPDDDSYILRLRGRSLVLTRPERAANERALEMAKERLWEFVRRDEARLNDDYWRRQPTDQVIYSSTVVADPLQTAIEIRERMLARDAEARGNNRDYVQDTYAKNLRAAMEESIWAKMTGRFSSDARNVTVENNTFSWGGPNLEAGVGIESWDLRESRAAGIREIQEARRAPWATSTVTVTNMTGTVRGTIDPALLAQIEAERIEAERKAAEPRREFPEVDMGEAEVRAVVEPARKLDL